MQEEVNEKTISLCIKGGKITAQILKAALIKLLAEINNSKVTDHHAILPTTQSVKCSKEKLSETKQKILSLIIWKLVQAVQPPFIYEDVLVTVCCQGQNFTAKYRNVLQPGYMVKPVPFVEPEKNSTKKDKTFAADLVMRVEEGRAQYSLEFPKTPMKTKT